MTHNQSIDCVRVIAPVWPGRLLAQPPGRFVSPHSMNVIGCLGWKEQKTGLRPVHATSPSASAGFLSGRSSPRITDSGREKA